MKKSLLFLQALKAFSVFAPTLSSQNKVRVKFARGTTTTAAADLKGLIFSFTQTFQTTEGKTAKEVPAREAVLIAALSPKAIMLAKS